MSTDLKTIDAYNKFAKEWSEKHKSNKDLNHLYNEKPAMHFLLPDLSGKTVLCIGCGSGEECDFLANNGATKVIGIDISEGLIEEAKKSYPEIEFKIMDMEKLEFENKSFDFVYSSLAVHYIEDWTKLMNEVSRVLKIGGDFLFSTMHPVFTGGEDFVYGEGTMTGIARYKDRSKGEFYVKGDYFTPRKFEANMGEGLEVTWHHKSIEQVLEYCSNSGLRLVNLKEPKPMEEMKVAKLKSYVYYSRIPLFLIVKVRKD
jgi:ubiquinone/menaquinone biosynthesis C-methylase UbiE